MDARHSTAGGATDPPNFDGPWAEDDGEEPPTAERRLSEALARALRAPRDRVAVVLRLSGLAPPAPRPYHRRIAHAVLEDAAARHDGAVFRLANGDAALLCRNPPGPAAPEAALSHPVALPHTFARLFRADAAAWRGGGDAGAYPAGLTTVWRLERDDEAALAYAEAAAASAARGGRAPCSRR